MTCRSTVSRALFAASSLLVAPATSLSLDLSDAKNRPVSKVMTLLKDMQKQLEKEATEDEEVYDKMACWCSTNDREKTGSISEAEGHIERLTTQIEELTAVSARLNTEIKNHEKEVAQLQAALDKATALREKQMADFNAEESDLLESISSLKSAVQVLSKHHQGNEAFLQMRRSHVLGVAATLKYQMARHASLLDGVLTPSEHKKALAFLQDPGGYMDAEPTFKQSYASQSGEIYGILTQLLESFQSNLATTQKEEMANQRAYEDLKAAKQQEIDAGTAQIEAKTAELSDVDEKNANSKVDLEETKATLTADEQFLVMLKEKCAMTDKEWEERQKTRQLEIEAVSKALSVLSGDDAHDLFTRTFSPSLLQAESSSRRAAASKMLAAVASKAHNPRLATLAYQVKLDSFTRVKKAIDDMISALLKEKADEIKHKDWCLEQLDQSRKTTKKWSMMYTSESERCRGLKMAIEDLTNAINNLKAEIREMQVQLKRAGEDRESQNKEFQRMVADQRATKELLTKALNFLKGFYEKNAPALVQRQEPAGPPPPAGFESYENNKQSGGVMSLIQQIIDDAVAMLAEAVRAEEEAQKAYEEFVKETNAAIEARRKRIVELSEEKGKLEIALVKCEKSVDEAEDEIEQENKNNAQVHESCDFILHNFDLRQTARDEEVEALRQAKAILSGAKFEEFLQTA